LIEQVDQGLLADLDQSRLRPIQIGDQCDDCGKDYHQQDGDCPAPRAGQAKLVSQ